MFTIDFFIDTVQNNKKSFINLVVSDANIKKGINEVIDAQTAFVKSASKNAIDITKLIVDNYTKAAKEAIKA